MPRCRWSFIDRSGVELGAGHSLLLVVSQISIIRLLSERREPLPGD